MIFDKVRQNLLFEAKASPNLLSDLSGLEKFISESYNNRSFIELLQNADDAGSTKFKIFEDNGTLFIANNGRKFSEQDFESLCRSASSKKLKGNAIGYRGIGFKSVVGFSNEIHLLSGDLEITFSKERTLEEIPEAVKVPLIRIPHPLLKADKEFLTPIQYQLNSEGYSTIFVFKGLDISAIESEFNSLDGKSLLFLKNILQTEISFKELIVTEISKKSLTDSESIVTLTNNKSNSIWHISHYNDSSIAFSLVDNKIVKLLPEESLLFAFLPTEDSNGLGVLINGNFSTDPSRRHLIYDNETNLSIKTAGRHIFSLLERNLKSNSNGNGNLINALVPSIDPRVLQFSKNSFLKFLFEYIQSNDSGLFKSIRLCPSWLNFKDFHELANSSDNHILKSSFYEIDGMINLLKFLGSKEVTFEELVPKINLSELSILGCAQLTKYIFKSLLSFNKNINFDFVSLKVIYSLGHRKSLSELNNHSLQIDQSFISLLIDNGLTEFDIGQVLKRHFPNIKIENQTTIIESEKKNSPPYKPNNNSNRPSISISDWFNNSKIEKNELTKQSIPRWRTAEELTLVILNSNGFRLEDVSKQNIGYDLDGFDPDGKEIQIEVKSISYPGQKFRMTNNEIAIAQEKRSSYFLALVRQFEEAIEIALISDPVNSLPLNRQCVQWIWECETYDYKPIKFPF